MLPLRVWVHCPRASNGLLPPRSYLVGYVRWYARSDSVLLFLLQTIISTAFSSHMAVPTAIINHGQWCAKSITTAASQIGIDNSQKIPLCHRFRARTNAPHV